MALAWKTLRYPVIPDYTDSEENFLAVLDLSKNLKSLVELNLLPAHHLGKARYESLGRPYPLMNKLVPDEVMKEMRSKANRHGVKCGIEG